VGSPQVVPPPGRCAWDPRVGGTNRRFAETHDTLGLALLFIFFVNEMRPLRST